MARLRAARHDEAGAALVLALVFVIVAALSLTALLTFAGGALLNTANLNSQRALEYAATSATDVAIQNVRYHPSAYQGATPTDCLGTASPTVNGDTMAVYCKGSKVSPLAVRGEPGSVTATLKTLTSTTLFTGANTFLGYAVADSAHAIVTTPPTIIIAENNATHTATLSAPASSSEPSDTFTLIPPVERTVQFTTCLAAAAPCSATNAVVTATVSFDDVTSTGAVACATTPFTPAVPAASATCGTSMVVRKWVVTPQGH